MVALILLIILIAAYVFVRYRQMTILKRNGINGPTPNLIYGNIFTHFNKPNVEKFQEYIDKYGNICGYYIGKKPNVIVTDLELIKNIQIKDFNKFSDRQNFGIKYGIRPNPKMHHHIISEKAGRWKEMRTILNPTFSAMKLKIMTPTIESAIDIFMNKVDKQAEKKNEFNIYDYFQQLTTDVIAKTALGIDTDVQNNPNDEFFKAAQKIFDMKVNRALMLFTCFPELDIIFYPLRRFIEIINEAMGNSHNMIIAKMITAAIKLRQNSSRKFNDLLQMMLDTKVSEYDIKNANASTLSIDMSNDANIKNESVSSVTNKKGKSLNHNEIVANAIIFYEAGYETTSTTLGFLAHVLVKYPEIQEKVREEVFELYEKEKKFDYNTVNKLSYMQCVINETMRYYPPVTTFITRNCNEDYHYKDIVIPKETTVRVPTYQLHHNEEYWPNHDVFDPERFKEKKNVDSIAFQAFGNGPRNCIGMRFALYEIKLALSKLLFKYQLVPGPSTEKELTIEYKMITETPKYGVFLKAIPLEK